MAKRLALRRRRARCRANRILMGAADGGKGELIAVGRVVPEEFAGPRTAEGAAAAGERVAATMAASTKRAITTPSRRKRANWRLSAAGSAVRLPTKTA